MTDSDPRSKKFRLQADQIRPVATGRGACIAMDRITVDGHTVCYAYREAPGVLMSTQAGFFAGDESQEYVDNPTNSTIYDINAIANYDPDIVAILDAPAPAAYQRSGRGEQFATVRTQPSRTKTSGMESLVRLSWACPNNGGVTLAGPAGLGGAGDVAVHTAHSRNTWQISLSASAPEASVPCSARSSRPRLISSSTATSLAASTPVPSTLPAPTSAHQQSGSEWASRNLPLQLERILKLWP